MSDATEKQLDFIEKIEARTGIPYFGTTKQDAWQYIHENAERYNQLRTTSRRRTTSRCTNESSCNPYAVDEYGIVDCYDMGICPWGDS